MSIDLYLIFLVTTVMLILVPGPAAITVASHGASHKHSKAFYTVLGVASADVIFFALSATGVASLILASNFLFSVIKWAGVAYLFYLGLTALFSKSGAINIKCTDLNTKSSRLFYQGLIIQLANPKALMYFTALLPQFVDPNKPVLFQMFLMGLTCFLADLSVYTMFSRLGDHLANQKLKLWVVNLINKAAGLTLLSTGIRMATLEERG